MDKVRDKLEDAISSGTKLLFFYKRKGNWKGVKSGGVKYAVPIMYELAGADSYSSYGQLDTTPFEGITDAFFTWRQAAAHVTISGLEEFQNRDSDGTRILDLLKTRTKQALLGLEDFFNKGMLQGLGKVDTTSLSTAYVSPITSASFIDPLPLLVKYDPTTSTEIGSINQSTNTWWRNFKKQSSATTYAGFLKELRNIRNSAGRGPGGAPDVYICDQQTFELYEAALAAAHRNPDYQKGDIPFETIQHYGNPVVWDENIPDVHTGSTTISKGTWYALNTNFLGVAYDTEHNFTTGPFRTPENQDARTAHILWYGTHWVSNRRKHGVIGNIDLTIAA